jgi:hypothetical protein
MLFFDGFLGIVAFGVWIFCIIDVITQPEQQIRNLPKLVWLLIVVLLADIGSIAWLIAGRPWNAPRGAQVPRTPQTPQAATPRAPDDDAEFLAQLRARAEEQRRRAREASERNDPPSEV